MNISCCRRVREVGLGLALALFAALPRAAAYSFHYPIDPPPPPVKPAGTSVLIDNFDPTSKHWIVAAAKGFPTSDASLDLKAEGYQGTKGAALTYDLTDGDPSASAVLNGLDIPGVTAISFWLMNPQSEGSGSALVKMRVIDSTGQVFQYRLFRPLSATDPNGWYRQVVPLSGWSLHWGGADDGKVHAPIVQLQIMAANPVDRLSAKGVIYFDDVYAITSPLQIDLTQTTLQSFLPPIQSSQISPILGMCAHRPNDADLQKAKAAGFRVARHDLTWANVEKSTGVYTWDDQDALIQTLSDNGFDKLILILDYSNPIYEPKNSSGTALSPDNAVAYQAFGAFANAAVRHLAQKWPGIQVNWEIWNEEDGGFWLPHVNVTHYEALLKSALQGIQAADPQAKVMVGGIAGFGQIFSYSFLTPLWSFIEGMSQDPQPPTWIGIHPYRQVAPETVSDSLAYGAALIPGARFLMSEWGYSSNWFGPVLPDGNRDGHDPAALDKQARFAVREMMTEWLSGSPLIIYYDLSDGSDNAENQETNFGLLDASGEPKLAMKAVQTMYTQTNGRDLVGVVSASDDSSARVLEYEKNAEDTLYMLWETLPNSQVAVKLPVGTTGVDMYGKPLAFQSSGSALTYTLRESPDPVSGEAGGPIYVHVPNK